MATQQPLPTPRTTRSRTPIIIAVLAVMILCTAAIAVLAVTQGIPWVVKAAAAKATPTQQVAAAFTQTPTKTVAAAQATPTMTVTPSATVQAPTASPTAEPTATTMAESYPFDLFDRSDGLCFVVEWESVLDSHRILESLYGIKIDKGTDTLVETTPVERGVDESTWFSRAILVDANSTRKIECGETQVRRPILFRMDPVEDLQVQWVVKMDNLNNPDFAAAYKAASVGSDHLGLFLGSEKGADVRVRTYDESGKLIDEVTYRVAGAYCSNCYKGTSLNGSSAQYSVDPEDFAFDSSKRKVLTSDVLAIALPKDFKGHYAIEVSAKAGHMTEWWIGDLRPLAVSPTPTPTATATP
jgi:hypothetical protein